MSIALAWVLLGSSSCWKTTQKDINNQKQKIELLSFNIENCINARKKLVNEHNAILAYPKTESNKYEIDNHLYLLEEQIADYDKKIKNFIEEKINAEVDLSKKIENRWSVWIHSSIDPNKRDYLLTIQ